MSAKKGTDYVFKIVAIVAVVLVIVAIGGFVAYYTNGFTNDFTTFYAVCDGNKILSSASGYRASRGEPLKVDVVYMFEDLSAEQNGYTVKVVPNVDANTDLDFSLNGDVYAFGAESDLTQGFDIVYEEKSFTLAPKGQLEDILAAVYPTYTVDVNKELVALDSDLFRVVITSYNGEASVSIAFSIPDSFLSGVTLDKEVIVF